jgi:hypothetical protein
MLAVFLSLLGRLFSFALGALRGVLPEVVRVGAGLLLLTLTRVLCW